MGKNRGAGRAGAREGAAGSSGNEPAKVRKAKGKACLEKWRPPDGDCLTMKEFRKVLGVRAGEAKMMAERLTSGNVTWDCYLKSVFLPKREPWVTRMRCKTKENLVELRININSLRSETRQKAKEIVRNRKPRGHQKLIPPRKRYNIWFDEKTKDLLGRLMERTKRTRGELVALMVEGLERSGMPTVRVDGENRPLSIFLGKRLRTREAKSTASPKGAALPSKQP
jgi:hypothetical protein